MLKNNSESSKKVVVTLDNNVTPIPSYELFLIGGNSDYMEVQLAKKVETDTEINVHVESIFRITKNAIPNFARQFSKYLQEIIDTQESQNQAES